MSSQKQDDQLIDQLFNGLKDFLNAPLPGTETEQQKPSQSQQPPAAPVVEEEGLLEKLKEILNQPLPGTADDADTTAPVDNKSTAQPAPKQTGIEGWKDDAATTAPAPAAQKSADNVEDWDDLKDRHKDEWEALKDRHEDERDALKERHEDERDILKDRHEKERDSLKAARKSRKREHKERDRGCDD